MRSLIGFLALLAIGRAQEFSSGAHRVHLLELFTSEGCSSCPPAERWFADTAQGPALWRDFVPVAWHVDYWDHLGWKDPFASKQATARQYAYANAWGAASVYTPCFVLDGHEWRSRILSAERTPGAGELHARCAGDHVTVAFGATDSKRNEAHLVILAVSGISNVRAGENAGRMLHHVFVAAGAEHVQPLRDGRAEFTIERPQAVGHGATALAVWITPPGGLAVLQATGGLLTP